MADTASYLFYSYWDINGHGISQDAIDAYAGTDRSTMIFDTYNRTIYAYGSAFGNHQFGTYHGEIFNDFAHNNASGDYSSAHGYSTYAGNDYETAIGKHNKYVEGSLLSVGNGNEETRSNALEVHDDVTYINTPVFVNGKQANVQSDWDETDNTSYAFIKNKPSNLVSMLNKDIAYYIWTGTEEEYDALEEKYANVIYIVLDSEEVEEDLPLYPPTE